MHVPPNLDQFRADSIHKLVDGQLDGLQLFDSGNADCLISMWHMELDIAEFV